jgi:hypothetical protein
MGASWVINIFWIIKVMHKGRLSNNQLRIVGYMVVYKVYKLPLLFNPRWIMNNWSFKKGKWISNHLSIWFYYVRCPLRHFHWTAKVIIHYIQNTDHTIWRYVAMSLIRISQASTLCLLPIFLCCSFGYIHESFFKWGSKGAGSTKWSNRICQEP